MQRLLGVFFLLALWPTLAYSDSADRALALALARVAAHEGALVQPRDLDLIWQVTENHGSTSARRLTWLYAHSGRAAGIRPAHARDANAFTAELGRDVTVPASVAALAHRPTLAYWKVKVMPRWQKLFDRAQKLVGGLEYDKPCSIAPLTWGGPMDHDKAAKNGRYPIGCAGTINDGFTTRAALVAAGRPPATQSTR